MIRPARDAREVAAAYALEALVFGPTPEAARSRRKLADRFDPPRPRDIIAEFDGREVAGFVRVIPRALIVKGRRYATGGVTNVCVHPSRQGQGLGRRLMEETIRILQRRGCALSATIARRAVDGFYPRFGYLGIDAFPTITVRGGESAPLAFDWTASAAHAKFHRAAYAGVGFTFERRASWWKSLPERVRLKHPGLRWSGLRRGSRVVGYAVFDGVTLIEGGSLKPDVEACVSALLGPAERVLRLPPAHLWLPALRRRGHTESTRAAWDGGHLVRALTPGLFRAELKAGALPASMRPFWNAVDEF